jgi:hypothetical protein
MIGFSLRHGDQNRTYSSRKFAVLFVVPAMAEREDDDIQLSMLENGLDFIRSGLKHIATPVSKFDLKYAILHLSAGIELEPFRMNERLTAQQGRFLCPRTLRVGFETNLKVALADAATRPNLKGPRLYKIIIPGAARLGLLEELDKMNINFATLFPGLEGFARSLRTRIELQHFHFTRLPSKTTAMLKDLFKDEH